MHILRDAVALEQVPVHRQQINILFSSTSNTIITTTTNNNSNEK